MRHRTWRRHVLDLQRDGIGLEDPDPDRQDAIALLVLEDHDWHVGHRVYHQPLDVHLNQHGPAVLARTFDTTASPHKLWGPARWIRTGIVRPIHSEATHPSGVPQFTTVLPLVRPEISV